MTKQKRLQLPQPFYDKPADTRINMAKEEADSLLNWYSGWVIINEVVWYLRTRPCDDGQVELRLIQAGGLD